MNEVWKDIEGYEGWYQVSNKGRIRSWHKTKSSTKRVTHPRILKPGYSGKQPYMQVVLSINGKGVSKYVHRIVAKEFIPNPENKPQINHKDGDKKNNSISNLEWCTSEENIAHSYEGGMSTPSRGENHGSSKLTKNDVLDIRNAYRLKCFTQKEIAKAYNTTKSNINMILNKKSWTHI